MFVVRTCKRACVPASRARVHPQVVKVHQHESCRKVLSRCVSPCEKNTIKQLNWESPPCAVLRKRYVGRIVACLENQIKSFLMVYGAVKTTINDQVLVWVYGKGH